jgi:hypothetical protein
MKHFIPTLLIAFFSAGILGAQVVPDSDNSEQPNGAKCVSLQKTKTGESLLVINYPWRTHKKTSIEVRLIPDKKDFEARVKPLRFSSIRFDDDTQRHIFHSFDEALVRSSDWKAEGGGLQWQVIGRANHRGHEAVWFVNSPKDEKSPPGTTAAFYPLDPWAINDKLLMLDLPRNSFDQPGKMYIWLLRGDQIIWQEDLMWPGKK